MLKAEDTIKDMEKGKRIYKVTEKNRESMMVEYKNSSLRANTLKRIAVLNSRNSINIPEKSGTEGSRGEKISLNM